MRKIPEVSYINPADPLWRQVFMRIVELMTGQPKLQRLYDDYKRTRSEDDNFWESAVKYLNVEINYDRAQLDALPKEGPLIVVANHPFGVLDGIAIGSPRGCVRTSISPTRSLAGPNLRPYLIRFCSTAKTARLGRMSSQAHRHAAPRQRRHNHRHPRRPGVDGGKNLRRGDGFAVEAFVAADATPGDGGADLFESEQLGFPLRLQFSDSMREAVLMREVLKQMGTEVVSHIGALIDPASLTEIGDRQAILDHLREAVYDLDQRRFCHPR